VKKADLPAAGLKGLLLKLETTFKVIGQKKMAKALKLENGQDDEEEEEDDDNGNGNDNANANEDGVPKIPILEESLVREMTILAAKDEEARKKARSEMKYEPFSNKKKPSGESLDFDIMFEKLLVYKEEHGHPNVPVKYQKDIQLGSWVSGLRTKKKAYDRDGEGMELDDEGWSLENNNNSNNNNNEEEGDGDPNSNNNNEGETPVPSTPNNNINVTNQKYLNPERIQRLESIGFAWSMARPKAKPKSWDERLEELKQWREEHGTYKVPRAESLGEWLHNQRTLYGKKDTKFMTAKAPRMEEIGYKFDVRENTAVSWDDRFQQLVEFRREHGNFDVPCPLGEEDDNADGDGMGNSEEIMERYKFYKWVTRLHNEYRAYEKGTSSKLNADRVEKLKDVDFEFKGPKSRGRPSTNNITLVPKLSWEKRLVQLQAFKTDTGHLNIDHNYKHCSNLGGWAAEMSTLYNNWKAGTQHLSEDMIAKFNQLIALGFQFNVLPYYENNRSWEDHYNVLLMFKENHQGSARVPLKYKADLRLGKWVQTQRQQYKLLQEGKRSKLTEDRIERLEDAGFEWEVAGGATAQEEDEDEMQV